MSCNIRIASERNLNCQRHFMFETSTPGKPDEEKDLVTLTFNLLF